MATTNDDKRLTAVTDEEKTALDNNKSTFDNMTDEATGYFDRQADAVQEWADKQKEIQNEQTDFAIERVNQQKAQAHQDYTKEQSGAYADWQKQSNPYGANAEQMAAQGMTGTGYSESSQVSMYNTYQNRVMAARESYNRAVLNYDNAIKEAQLQNSSILAEIAYEALQKQLELSLQGFQYRNELVLKKADRELQIKSLYQQKYQDVLSQINTENALAEEQRQFNETMAENKRQFDKTFEAQYGGGGSVSPSKTTKYSNSQNNARANNRDNSIEKSNDVGVELLEAWGVDPAVSAVVALNQLIASGASKDKVSNEIALALRNGAITKEEAAKLRSTFTPRGLQY